MGVRETNLSQTFALALASACIVPLIEALVSASEGDVRKLTSRGGSRQLLQSGSTDEMVHCEAIFELQVDPRITMCEESSSKGALVVDLLDKGNINHGLHQVVIPWLTAIASCRSFIAEHVDTLIVEDRYFRLMEQFSCGWLASDVPHIRSSLWIGCSLFLPLEKWFDGHLQLRRLGDRQPLGDRERQECFRTVRSYRTDSFNREPPLYTNPNLYLDPRSQTRSVLAVVEEFRHLVTTLAKNWADNMELKIKNGNVELWKHYRDIEGLERFFHPRPLEKDMIRVVFYGRQDSTRRPWLNGVECYRIAIEGLKREFPGIHFEITNVSRWPKSFFAQAYLISQGGDVIMMPHGANNANTIFMNGDQIYVETTDRCTKPNSVRNTRWSGWVEGFGLRRILVPCLGKNMDGSFSVQDDIGNENFPMRVIPRDLLLGMREAIAEILIKRDLRSSVVR